MPKIQALVRDSAARIEAAADSGAEPPQQAAPLSH
jgi:hypothetical protein